MTARGTLRLFIVVLLTAVCIGFVAVVGMSAAAAPGSAADGGDHDGHEYDGIEHEQPGESDDYEPPEETDDGPSERKDSDGRTRVNVHATQEALTVAVGGENPVDVAVEATEGDYAGEGEYRLEPGDTLELPAPDEPTTVRILAESDDARLEVTLGFESYEYDCGAVTIRQVAPAEASYEWEGAGEERSRTHTFERPPVECPEPPGGDDPGGEGPPSEDPEDAYNDTRDEFWSAYEDGNETAWDSYRTARAVAWGGYEDGRTTFWDAYERLTDGGDGGDPQDRVNETRDDAEREVNDTRSFAERVGEDAQEDAERLQEDGEAAANRVENDTRGDVERVREDAEEDRRRLENETNRTLDELTPDGDGDNESDDDGPVPEDLPPEDFPPEDFPPGDDNESDDPLPDGEAVSADADADAGRDGDTFWASGSATVDVADGTAHAHVYERLAVEPDTEP